MEDEWEGACAQAALVREDECEGEPLAQPWPGDGAGEDVGTCETPEVPELTSVVGERPDPMGPAPSELTPHELGQRGEDMAADYLERHGWDVLERNWRCPFGEVDIVALDRQGEKDVVALVEVKTRLVPAGASDVAPEVFVDWRKQRRYRTLALCYLLGHSEVFSLRFDVIGIGVQPEGGAHLRHLPNAFAWDE